MKPIMRRVVELKGYQELGQSLLPAIRRAVQELQQGEQLGEAQQLCDIGLSRQGERIYLHLYYASLEEGV